MYKCIIEKMYTTILLIIIFKMYKNFFVKLKLFENLIKKKKPLLPTVANHTEQIELVKIDFTIFL